MKQSLAAAFLGLLVSLLMGACILWWQRSPAASVEISLRTEVIASKQSLSAESVREIVSTWQEVRGLQSQFSEFVIRAYRSLSTLDATACRAIAESALSLPEDERYALVGDVLARWVTLDGDAAMTWALENVKWSNPVFAQLGAAWAWRDPAAVAAWQQRMLENEQTRGAAKPLAIEGWLAGSDAKWCASAAAAGIIVNQNSSGGGWRIIKEAVTTPEQAAAFAEGLCGWEKKLTSKEGQWNNESQAILSALRDSWQRLDPDGWDVWATRHSELACLARTRMSDEESRFLNATQVSMEADRWLANSSPSGQAETLTKIVNAWAPRDLDGAGKWLSAQGAGENTWKAAEAFALHAVAVDPEAALEWAASIGDGSRRTRAERRAFLRWHDRDATTAEEWLASCDWEPEQVTAVQEMMAVRPP